MISIIIPAYNCAKTIGECLTSIFAQTEKDVEVIIVDDGSTDDLGGVLAPWQNKIKLMRQANKGAPAARNYGFSISHGQYVLFLDADIVMKPDMLEKMLAAMQNDSQVAFAYSSFKWGWKKFRLWPFDSEKLKVMPYIHTSSIIRREAFPGFDEYLKKFQDWDLFLTISEKGGKGAYIPKTLFRVISEGTMSSWFPKILFGFPIKPKAVREQIKKYETGREIIRKKHGLQK